MTNAYWNCPTLHSLAARGAYYAQSAISSVNSTRAAFHVHEMSVHYLDEMEGRGLFVVR